VTCRHEPKERRLPQARRLRPPSRAQVLPRCARLRSRSTAELLHTHADGMLHTYTDENNRTWLLQQKRARSRCRAHSRLDDVYAVLPLLP
jgi:hypothetical protein